MSLVLRIVAAVIAIVGIGLWLLTITGSMDETGAVRTGGYIIMTLIAIILVVIVLFGIQGLAFGKIKMTSILLMAFAAVVVAICFMVAGGKEEGAILAFLAMTVLAVVGVLISGVKAVVGI